MKIGRFTTQVQYSVIGAFVLASFAPSMAFAQDHGSHAISAPQQTQAADQKKASGLVKVVRDATERQNVAVAEAEGYASQFGCVSGGDYGAMGMHFVNGALVGDGEIDATRPEIVIYEPQPNGRLKLIGADYLVLADQWNATHAGPPELMGQLFHFFEAPNRFGLPPFYTLHVWAWKENPTGSFVNWHSNVTCDAFSGQNR
jgi:hypothetical protein